MGWLKRKVLAASSKSQEKELRAGIQRLKGMSNDEIGFLVAGSALLRLNLTSGGVLPPEALDLSMPRDEFKMDMIPIKLGSMIRQFQKMATTNKSNKFLKLVFEFTHASLRYRYSYVSGIMIISEVWI